MARQTFTVGARTITNPLVYRIQFDHSISSGIGSGTLIHIDIESQTAIEIAVNNGALLDLEYLTVSVAIRYTDPRDRTTQRYDGVGSNFVVDTVVRGGIAYRGTLDPAFTFISLATSILSAAFVFDNTPPAPTLSIFNVFHGVDVPNDFKLGDDDVDEIYVGEDLAYRR